MATGKQPGGGIRRGAIEGLPVVRRDVAGVDLGSERHWVCAPAKDGNGREVADFGATTPELVRMAEWLLERQVASVAMESTGVYWIAPFEILEGRGLEMLLVDTRQLARVPGRDKKTDPTDCEWIQRLHSCGLLRGSYRPNESICMLRTLIRDKANLVAQRGDCVRRMQKSLDQMNVRVHRAVSGLDGVTGLAIVRAIVGGERDARKLAQLRDARCRKTEEEIAGQLSGHWRQDHLFSLRQGVDMYEKIEQQIGEYDREILRRLDEMQREDFRNQAPPAVKNAQKAKGIRKRGEEPMRGRSIG
jgi:transposase